MNNKEFSKEEVIELIEKFRIIEQHDIFLHPSTSDNDDILHTIRHTERQYKDFLKEKGLIKESFEVGKWIKKVWNDGTVDLFMLKKIKGNRLYNYADTYFQDNKLLENDDSNITCAELDDTGRYILTKATPDQIKEALNKELNNKYNSGDVVECLAGGCHTVKNEDFNNIEYDEDGDLWLGDMNVFDVYGKWATIIEDKEEVIKNIASTKNVELLNKLNEIIDFINGETYIKK